MSNTVAKSELTGEDWARADFYGLIGHFFSGHADDAFLAHFKQLAPNGESDNTPLGQAFQALCEAVTQTDARTIKVEYDDCFVGVGRPDVYLYASYYLSGFLHERPLVKLREDLAELGLGRDESVAEPEDHIAFLCETMRYLIVADDPPISIARQQEFFQRHIAPWFEAFCEALQASPKLEFFKVVGHLTETFLSVERQSFEFEHAI